MNPDSKVFVAGAQGLVGSAIKRNLENKHHYNQVYWIRRKNCDLRNRIHVDQYFDFDIEWHKSGMDEVGYSRRLARNIITVNERYFRPAEVERLSGDATKAKKVLGWEPKTSFDQLVKEMCENES